MKLEPAAADVVPPDMVYLLTMELGDVALDVSLLPVEAELVWAGRGAGVGSAGAALVLRAGLTGVGGSTAGVG